MSLSSISSALAVISMLTLLVGRGSHAQEMTLRRPAGGYGIIEATDFNAASRLSARVEEVLVRKGQEVKQGELLMRLDCSDARAARDEAEARLEVAEAQVAVAEAQLFAAWRELQAAQASADMARAQQQATEAQRNAARRQAARLEQLAEGVAEADVDQTQTKVAELNQQAKAARKGSTISQRQAEAAQAQSRAAELQVEVARNSAEAAEATLSRAVLMEEECEVSAPGNGLVEEIFYEQGELPPPGAPLVRIINLDEVRAVFYLPNAELAAAMPHRKVTLEADTYPGQSFDGTILTVSAEAVFTPRNIQTREDRDRLVYTVEARVTNSNRRLRPGMPVRVTIPEALDESENDSAPSQPEEPNEPE